MRMLDEKLLVFVLGAPGAGKGTQCELVVKEYGWTHISAGDLLRAQVEAGTEAGKEAQKYLEQGTMVPAAMIIGLLKQALSGSQHSKVLIDGFPRVLDQLSEFEAQVRPCDAALFYNVPEEVARARLLKRAETSGRCDDNEDTIRRRFVVFREESMRVVEALKEQGRAVELDAALPADEVFAETRRVIERLEQEQEQKQQQKQAPEGEQQAAAGAGAATAEVPAAAAAADAAAAAPAEATAAAAAAAAADSSSQAAVAAPPTASTPTSPAAAAAAAIASTPASPTPSVGSLQVDLSGIRTPIVICGPSGVGKGTLIAKLMAQHGDRFGFSVSHTTRAPRPGEQDGQHYYFSDVATMQAQVDGGMFLEHAMVHGNMYGTSLAAVARVSAEGKHCVLDIDVQGAALVRRSALGPACCFVFVAPPSHEELERRLRSRGTEAEDKVLQRLANARAEIAKAQEPGLFHHVLVNGDLERAYQELLGFISHKVPGLLPSPRTSTAGGGSQRVSEAGSIAGAAAAAGLASPRPSLDAAGGGAPSAAAATAATAAAAAATATAAAAAAAAAATAAATTSAPQQQQEQQQQQQQPAPQPLANGSTAPAAHGGGGGTAGLLDFGFGASSGHCAVAAKGMPVRQYMDALVVPVLREGLRALNAARPDDPLQFLADYLVAHKAAAQ